MTLGPTGFKRLLYIDTHAGRGKHLTGELGSPLVALSTLLNHTAREAILSKARLHYLFIERDTENVAALQLELASIENPQQVTVEAVSGDFSDIIEKAFVSSVSAPQPTPAFIFVDPFGFKLPGGLLRNLLSYPKVELFVNIMWRELDLAICNVRKEQAPAPTRRSYSLFDDGPTDSRPAPVHPKKKAALEAILNIVFDGDRWRSISAESADDRADECATLFKQMTGATWGTHLRMMDNGRIRYFLLHLTKHDDGRRLMKTCMWKASPSGGFVASKSDNPHQQLLIEREPDLEPLQELVTRQLRMRPMRWKELSDHLVEELWLDTHLNSVLKEMKQTGELISEGKFAKTQNPLLRLAP